jgi:hypothetical protein
MARSGKSKNEKIPYQQYQAMQAKAARRFFKFTPYPWPVFATLIIPLSVFILMTAFYFLVIRNLPE